MRQLHSRNLKGFENGYKIRPGFGLTATSPHKNPCKNPRSKYWEEKYKRSAHTCASGAVESRCGSLPYWLVCALIIAFLDNQDLQTQ